MADVRERRFSEDYARINVLSEDEVRALLKDCTPADQPRIADVAREVRIGHGKAGEVLSSGVRVARSILWTQEDHDAHALRCEERERMLRGVQGLNESFIPNAWDVYELRAYWKGWMHFLSPLPESLRGPANDVYQHVAGTDCVAAEHSEERETKFDRASFVLKASAIQDKALARVIQWLETEAQDERPAKKRPERGAAARKKANANVQHEARGTQSADERKRERKKTFEAKLLALLKTFRGVLVEEKCRQDGESNDGE